MSLTLEHYRIPKLDNLELLYFPKVTQDYPKHFHHDYAICFMTSGQVQTHYRSSTFYSTQHSFTLMNPDEVHAGLIQGEAASYFSFYPSISLVKDLMEDSFASQQLPYFRESMITNKALQNKFRAFVQAFEIRLETESHFLAFIEHLIVLCTDGGYQLRKAGREPKAIEKARAYLHAHFASNISLNQLASSVNLNRSYLIRTFKQATGLSPHRYLLHLRLQEARKRLSQGYAVTQVALEAGFSDQSHFTRAFKAAFAMTPAHYAKVTFVPDKP